MSEKKNYIKTETKYSRGMQRDYGLTTRQQKFAENIASGMPHSQSYIEAGYNVDKMSRENIGMNANRLLKMPKIQDYIEDLRQPQREKILWSREKALKKLVKIADDETSTISARNLQITAIREANKMCGFDIPEKKNDDKNSGTYFIPAKDMSKAYIDVNRDIDERKHLEYWFLGGRGSLKSTYISEKILELIYNNESMCAMIIRSVKDTLKDSVFSQILWAINMANMESEFRINKSPLEITRISTGQKIYFRGCDDPMKIKSTKPPINKYIGIVWYEEFDQLKGMNEIRTVNQSIIRGGEDFVEFYSCNTPASNRHFVNIEANTYKKNRLVHRSTYWDVPSAWLGETFITEAEYLQENNERAYKHEYLGEPVNDGGSVFENVEIREITDEEINSFDSVYNGLDWGWIDPYAFNRCSYNPNTRILYIYEELHGMKTSNGDLANIILDKVQNIENQVIVCDSAEPKSIADIRSYGIAARPAEKGPGSLNYGMKWLQSLVKIIIDNKRCPHTTEEFTTYEYERTKDGEIISSYPDGNDHHISAIRYALEPVWRRSGQ